MPSEGFMRRSPLVVPASSSKMIDKSVTLEADAFVFDLEDGVAPSAKDEARRNIGKLGDLDFGSREVAVRINGIGTPWFLDDLLAIENAAIDTVVIPKVHGPDDVVVVETLIRQFSLRGRSRDLSLQLLIESAAGVETAGEIAKKSPLVEAIIFGAGDYAADVGGSMTRNGLSYARGRIAVAAAAARIEAIDYVHPIFDDDDGLRDQVDEAKEMGYRGKWAIHPRQLPIINQGFSPTAEEVNEAIRMLSAYETAKAAGKGSTSYNGMLLDEPVLAIMRQRVEIARRIGTTPHLQSNAE